MAQIDQRELDEYLYKLKSEITNLRLLNDKLTLQVTNMDDDNINLKSQVSKLAIENSTLEYHIRTKKVISSVVYESYRDIITKLENVQS